MPTHGRIAKRGVELFIVSNRHPMFAASARNNNRITAMFREGLQHFRCIHHGPVSFLSIKAVEFVGDKHDDRPVDFFRFLEGAANAVRILIALDEIIF